MDLSLRLNLLEKVATRWQLRGCAEVGDGTLVRGRVWIHGEGRVVLGKRVRLDGSKAPIELHAQKGAEILIGDDVLIEGGASIEAVRSVVIEPRCVLRGYCKILDNHFHPLKGNRHERPSSEPVRICEGAEVGERAIILPGTSIGRGTRLCSGVVISRRVPAGMRLSGSPARAERQEKAG